MEWLTEPHAEGVVSCDWFGVSCMLGAPYDGRRLQVPPDWIVQECSSTAVWMFRWFILDRQGNKVATVLAQPKSPIIDQRRALVEIANRWLYYDSFPQVLDIVLCCLPMKPTGMNRVDLCCDFEMTQARWSVFRLLEDGRAYLKGLRKGVVWWSNDGRSRVPHQISWGGKDSKFHWKIYYKYKELHEGGVESTKPYIEELWRMVGMDPKMVWRCEVSVSDGNGLTETGTDKPVPYYQWWHRRVELFCRIYGDRFVVREHQGHKDSRHDPVLRFLNVGGTKVLQHKLRSDHEVESDVERRIVCKLWKEFTDSEVRCNDFAMEGLREHIAYMFQRARNVAVVARRFGLTEPQVLKCLADAK